MLAERELVGVEQRLVPLCVINLLNMKRYEFRELMALATLWSTLAGDYLGSKTPHDKLTDDQIAKMKGSLDRIQKRLVYLELPEAAKYTRNIHAKLGASQCDNLEQYFDQATVLWEIVVNEIEEHVWGFIPKSHGSYFKQEALFGEKVNEEFDGAIVDIREAGTCYALGRYTASVFHLMRVLEIALHKLANDLGVAFPAAIELENWHNIIEKIESAIRDREKQLPKGMQKSAEMQYYSEAAKEFRYFKDAWRNHVSHSRVEYDIHDATKIMEHVREFMQHLAKKA